ncbi:class I SAM-dependent methyltransferase [Acinetobacter sp. ANC 4910]|uniref:class I SAM-dependent methyltransferase n=1 Tax=Acinetobacter sp. ANC 4910 TaxID=2529850 RepID=UPI00103FF467|nr:class I SAM-dependent methyltransferase [Acinetobacter sp. ANC 4910]TCB34594.1 class I SAM-dependent methyltransferase [Acinetobacter sp. ANC 4910]
MLYQFYQQQIFPHLLNQVMQTPSLMDKRRELLLPVAGEVLEIGFGTGINLPFYQNVDLLYALEPNQDIFKLASSRIFASDIEVQHLQARAEHIPLADHSIDHVVSTWTLCSVKRLDQVLQEIQRVLKPNGTLHLVEHVLNTEKKSIRQLQHLITPIQKRLADGCRLNRNIELALLKAGFSLTQYDYFYAEGIPQIGQQMLLAHVQKASAS